MTSTILVADDDRAIRLVLSQALSQLGHDVRAASDAATLWNWIERGEGDVVIADVIMPDLNGIEAAIQMRTILPKIKILLFSGQAATADLLEKARAQGYEFEILAKPVHPQDLLARLRG